MIRRLTKNEKSCNPNYDYIIELNSYKYFIDEKDFQILTSEVKNLNIPSVIKSVCTYRNHSSDIVDYGNCRKCGEGFKLW